jgi:hypothetical protein
MYDGPSPHGLYFRSEEEAVTVTTKQALTLLTRDDEAELAQAIAVRVPEVKFLDFGGWQASDHPPVCDSVLTCGPIVSIWNPLIVPTLPTGLRSDGKVVGPQIGPVIQWLRSPEPKNHELQSGRLAASYDESSPQGMVTFIELVWKALMSVTDNKLSRASGGSGDMKILGAERRFRIGANARLLASVGSLVLLSGKMRLVPEGSSITAE